MLLEKKDSNVGGHLQGGKVPDVRELRVISGLKSHKFSICMHVIVKD